MGFIRSMSNVWYGIYLIYDQYLDGALWLESYIYERIWYEIGLNLICPISRYVCPISDMGYIRSISDIQMGLYGSRAIYMSEFDTSRHSPFPRRWDLKCSSKCKSKSSIVKVHVSFQMSPSKRDLGWPSRISVCIPMTISSLIFFDAWLWLVGSLKL